MLGISLDNEESVIKAVQGIYNTALKDIDGKIEALLARSDADMTHVIYQADYQRALRKEIAGILDTMQASEFKTVSEYLTKCYDDAFTGALYDFAGQGIPFTFPIDQEAIVRAVQLDTKLSKGLYSSIGENTGKLKRSIAGEISRGISTGSSYHDIARNIKGHMVGAYTKRSGGALYRSELIARTEGHRIQAQGAMDACSRAKANGADVVKQWDSALDARTRPSHAKVDGEIRELDEPFSNGLMYPGDPAGGAAEVCNCRCALLQRARWALDEAELETLKERAAYLGLDKVKNFEDYREKYLKAVEITGNSDTIESKYGFHRISGEHTREADLAATNPKYGTQKREYTQNCQRCVSAYEARRRGFDVEALPRILDGSDRMPYMFDKKEGWTSVYDGIQPVLCSSNRTAGVKKKVEDAMRGYGDGARAIVRVQWQQKYGGGGHVFIAEQVDGMTIFIDPQTNNLDVSGYFTMAKTKETYVMRIDDLEFTDNITKCCKNAE